MLELETQEQEAQRWARLLNNWPIELRALPQAKGAAVLTAIFTDPREFAETAVGLSDRTDIAGVYATINRLPALPSSALGNGFGMRDNQVARRTTLLVDFDPVRAGDNPKVCATDQEKEAAGLALDRARELLDGLGWPEPIQKDTGNGCALEYRIDLPNNAASTALIRAVLAALADRFDSEAVKVDRSVFNASRISRVPGTVNRKSPHTYERPNWPVMMLSAPDRLEPVSVEQLEAVAGEKLAATQANGKPDPSLAIPFDHSIDTGKDPMPGIVAQTIEAVVEALDAAKLRRGEPEYDAQRNATRIKIPVCPCVDHPGLGDPAIFIWHDTADVTYKCFNDTCVHNRLPQFAEATGLKMARAIEAVVERAAYGKHRHNDPLPLAKAHLAKFGGAERFAYFRGQAYRYEHGRWHATDYDEIGPWIRHTIQEEFEGHAERVSRLGERVAPKAVSPSLIRSVYVAMCSLAKRDVPTTEQSPFFLAEHDWQATDVLPLRNGILNVARYVRGEPDYFRDSTPALFCTAVCDFDFVEDAGEPTVWLAFLDSLERSQAWIDQLQELCGYLLWRGYDLQRFFLLAGVGRAGKGIIARVMTALVGGPLAVCAPDLETFLGPHGLEGCLDKTLALIPEATIPKKGAAQVVRTLKALTGGDAVAVNPKNRPIISVTMRLKIVGLSNNFVVLADNSGALGMRLITLPFAKSFAGQENTKLADGLKPEYPAILLWALKGLKRLVLNGGRFTISEESARYATQQQDESAPIPTFLRDCCEVDANKACQTVGLYAVYKQWYADQYGEARPLGEEDFSTVLCAAVPTVDKTRSRPASYMATDWDTAVARPRYWLGVAPTAESSKDPDKKTHAKGNAR